MNVPGNRIYISRTDEGDGVFNARDHLGDKSFGDSKPLGIAKRLAAAAKIQMPKQKYAPEPARVSRPQKRLYRPVDEAGAVTRFAILDRTTGLVLARCYGSAFHVACEGVKLCKSQGVPDSEFRIEPVGEN